MSVHYFSPAPQAGHRLRQREVILRGRTFRLLTDRAVFAARGLDRGTRLLIETMEVRPDDVILDLGCGYGVIGLVAATLAPRGHVHMVDINVRAADLAQENAVRNRVGNVTVHRGDGVEPVRGIAFDLVLTNPPIRAGRATVLRLFAGAHVVLRPGGRLRFVTRTALGARTLARHVSALFGNVREVARGGGFRVYEAIRERADV